MKNNKHIKFQYISDLHLEFKENREFLKKNPIKPVGDVLLVAGDFTYSNRDNMPYGVGWKYDSYGDEFLDYFSKNWKYTILVPGNHEYYGYTHSIYITESLYIKERVRPNVIVLNNSTLFLGKKGDSISELPYASAYEKDATQLSNVVRILGTTLWSFIPYEAYNDVRNGMNDYNYSCYDKNEMLSVGRTIELFYKSMNFLRGHLSINYPIKCKNIILTHHMPSFKCIYNKYVNNKLNAAYASNLEPFIKQYKPDAWVFGHSHNIGKWKISKTNLYSASFGYAESESTDKLETCLSEYFVV